MLRSLTLSILFLCFAVCVPAQTVPLQVSDTPEVPRTVFSHAADSRFYIAGQANIVFQAHPGMHSPYQAANSFVGRGEYKVSLVGTLFGGVELVRKEGLKTEFILDVESSGGRGISQALGLAGFTNLDVVRNPSLGPKPYIARVQLHQSIGLGKATVESARSPFSLATRVPVRRLDFRIGRMSLPDVFDLNGPGSDSHLQFLNWTADNNGAWDYAADTRGYTYAAVAEYDDKAWSARYAVALMPTVANGINLDWNLRRARGENYELEFRHLGGATPWWGPGTLRVLGFVNHGNMGRYRDAVKASTTTAPDISDHLRTTTVKYGTGINFEQNISNTRVFGRFGWNEGQHESFCYTEVDETFSLGADITGERWGRRGDRAGAVGISNAIKRDHQAYLAAGGQGFLLGDGRLQYAREDILEAYYTAHTWRGIFTAFDLQVVAHPGYNRDRGPAAVFGVRTHIDF